MLPRRGRPARRLAFRARHPGAPGRGPAGNQRRLVPARRRRRAAYRYTKALARDPGHRPSCLALAQQEVHLPPTLRPRRCLRALPAHDGKARPIAEPLIAAHARARRPRPRLRTAVGGQPCAGPRRLAPRSLTMSEHSSLNPAPSPGLQPDAGAASPRGLDAESKAWVDRLGPDSRDRDTAIADLHALLLKGARFEVNRRRAAFPQLRGDDHDDLAHQSADDALLAVLGKLDEFRGDSRFTTWAYKFALFEAGTKVRRRAWQGREVPLEPESWARNRRRGLDATPGRRDGRAVGGGARRDRGRPHPAPARGLRRRHTQRGPDRRPGRATQRHPRGALQDHPRRPRQAPRGARRARARRRRPHGDRDDKTPRRPT